MVSGHFHAVEVSPPSKSIAHTLHSGRRLGGLHSRFESFEEEKNLSHMQVLKSSSLVIQPAVSCEHQLHYAGSLRTVEGNKKSFRLLNRQICCYFCIVSILSNLVEWQCCVIVFDNAQASSTLTVLVILLSPPGQGLNNGCFKSQSFLFMLYAVCTLSFMLPLNDRILILTVPLNE